MSTNTHQPTYLRDYAVPPYLIEEAALEFELDEAFTVLNRV